jgi:hypothetical protein
MVAGTTPTERFTVTGTSGMVGISTGNPQARLDVMAAGSTPADMGQIWRRGDGVVVGSMSATGVMEAVKFLGDGSSLTGIGGNDNLGNHTATTDLKMQGYSIVNAASGTFNQALTTYSSMTVAGALGVSSPKYYLNPNVEISSYSASYGTGISVSTMVYTPGMVLTGFGELQSAGAGRGTITGNARGPGAVDLQVNRSAVTQVASGGYAVIGGGQQNLASGQYAVVPGGSQNTASNQYSTVGGGIGNNASGDGSAIPGGYNNSASGTYSLAAGYKANSVGNGAFTWADSAGVQLNNNVTDMTLFKDRGGFEITGSTNPVISGTVDRAVFVSGGGMVGISTGAPQAALDVVAAGAAVTDMAQIWRNSAGVIMGSMSATGYLTAVKFVGNGSGLTGTGDNLGNHTATTDLNIANNNVLNVSSITMQPGGMQIATGLTTSGNGIYISSYGAISTVGMANGTALPSARGANAVDLQSFRNGAANVASGQFASLLGGWNNTSSAQGAVVAGGGGNAASGAQAAILGGNGNTVSGQYSSIAGGTGNNINGATNGFIGGGNLNYIATGQGYSVISGGSGNYIYGGGNGAMIPGGYNNTAMFNYSLAAGYYSSSTANGAFTWADSQGAPMVNNVQDQTVFKNRGGFIITGSTNTSMTGSLDRGMFVTGGGMVGIATGTPQAALDVVGTAASPGVQDQIWRNSAGVIVGSMSSTGFMTAVKFVGDGSGLSGTADNLGNHTAIQDLNMSGYSILNATSVYVNAGTLGTVSGSSQTLASLQFSDTNGDKLMAISTRTADGSDWTTAGVMLKRRVDLTDMGYIKFGSQSSDLLTFGRNQSEYVRIDSAGNVGIGNNNPTTKLSVGGTTQVDFDTSNSGKVVIKVGGVAVAEMLPN